MAQALKLSAQARVKVGKNANRQLREQGIIPAIYYNTKGESRPIQVQEAALMKLYAVAGRTSLFDLEIEEDGKKTTFPCLIWDVEYYPTKYRFQHVDFYCVDLEKDLKIRVSLEFIGTSKGVKAGGKLETYRDQIEVLSKPGTLPKKIVVDISNLDINQGFRVADLAMPEGVRASYDDNFAIVNVNAPGSGDEKDEK